MPAPDTAGAWAVTAFDCNGVVGPVSATRTVHVTVALETLACTFSKAFTATPTTITATTTTATPATPATTTTVPGRGAATDTGANGTGSGKGLAMTGEDMRIPLGIALVLAGLGASLMALDRTRRRGVPVAVDLRCDRPST